MSINVVDYLMSQRMGSTWRTEKLTLAMVTVVIVSFFPELFLNA